MTDAEFDAELDKIAAEVKERYRRAPDDMHTLAMMLQDLNAECAKRIPDWKTFKVQLSEEQTAQ